MQTAIRIIKFLFAVLMGVVGIFGVPKEWATSEDLRGLVHSFIDNYYGKPILLFTGWLLLAYCLADELSRRRVDKVLRNQPANFSAWDEIERIAIWQIAWLWNDLEPQNDKLISSGLPYTTFQRLKEHLEKGLIKNVAQVDGSWMECRPTKQALVDYAIKLGQTPKFLFPSKRNLLEKLLYKLCHKKISTENMQDYRTTTDYFVALSGQTKLEDINKYLWEAIQNGNALVIGKPISKGIHLQHELIPKRAWHNKSMTEFFYGNSYSDIRIKLLKK